MEKFWIVKGRQQVKTAWLACVECQKLTSPPFQELAAPLPLNQLRQAQAFHITGVDFAGHLFYKPAPSRRKAKALTSVQDPTSTDDPSKEPAEELLAEEDAPNEAPLAGEETPTEEDIEIQDIPPTTTKAKKTNQLKSYACLFTCAVTRAIHLELMPDMTARSFLFALRKFAARRGPISVMYSDNAQTFRCVDRHLKLLNSDPTVQDYLAARKTLWIYSASLAPWWGGFWERMVRSVKDLLRRSNGRACLDYMELEASLIEIESVINARPLSYIGEGADDPLPITPNQFLNNRRSTRADPEPATNLIAPTSTSTKLLEMDKLRRKYVADICSRFVDDYLRQLDNFHSKGKPGRKIRLGEIVVINDENSKRLKRVNLKSCY